MVESTSIVEPLLRSLSQRRNPSLRGLTAELGYSSSWIRKQIKKLRQEGVITAWQFVLHPSASLQQRRILFFLLKTNPNEPQIVEELLRKYTTEKLSSLEGVTGEYSIMGRFHFPSGAEFLASLDHLYQLIGGSGFQKYELLEVISVQKEWGFIVPESSISIKRAEYKVLQTIQELGKIQQFPPSTYDIAKKLGKHQPSIYRQLKRWKRGNVILGYSVRTTYWQEHYIHAYIQIKAPLGRYQVAIDFCHQDTHVVDCFRTNHEYSLLIKTRHSTLTDLNDFLKALYKNTEVTDTITHIILDELRF
ncbi:MAG: hypothetical protein ACFFFG_02115 [Candidatus Thorarchaeota archaeon]